MFSRTGTNPARTAPKPASLERLRRAFDDEGAHPGRVPVVMGVECPLVGTDECLGQRLEPPWRSEPGEVVGEVLDVRGEGGFVGPANQGVEPVGTDNQIGVQLFDVPDRMGEARRRPESLRPRAQNLDQLEPSDCRESDAVERHGTLRMVENQQAHHDERRRARHRQPPVPSPGRLYRGWSAAQRARRAGRAGVASYVETLLAPLAGDARIVTVIDGHPATHGRGRGER